MAHCTKTNLDSPYNSLHIQKMQYLLNNNQSNSQMCSYGQVSIMCQDSFLVCDPHGMKYSTIRASNVNLFTELDHQVLNLVGDCLILIEYPVKRQLVGAGCSSPDGSALSRGCMANHQAWKKPSRCKVTLCFPSTATLFQQSLSPLLGSFFIMPLLLCSCDWQG